MTPDQRELARHALGLSKHPPVTTSYRNRFVAGAGHVDHADWQEMVENGEAVRRDGNTLPFGGDDLFWLTRKGAEAALSMGETLDSEDFPPPDAGHPYGLEHPVTS